MVDNRIKRDSIANDRSRESMSAADRLLNSLRNASSRDNLSNSRIRSISNNVSRFRSTASSSRRSSSNQINRQNHSSSNNSNRSQTNRSTSTQSTSISRDGILLMLVDSNNDKEISLEEIIQYVINTKARGQQISENLYKLHPKFKDVVEILGIIDTNSDLNIDDTEAINALLKDRAGLMSNQGIDKTLVNFVIGYLNDNKDELSNAVSIIDTNSDGAAHISDLEVLAALLSSRRGELDIDDPNVDTVLRTNSNYPALLAAVASMGIDFNGTISNEQTFDILLALRGGDTGEAIIQQALFLSTNTNLTAIENSVTLFDNDANGVISNEEFVSIMMQSRSDARIATENQIAINVLKNREPYQSLFAIIDSLDSSSDGFLSDDEIIDFSLASLRGDISFDSSLVEQIIHSNNRVDLIRGLISQIDTETGSSGIISNEEFIEAVTELLADPSIGPISRSLINKILRNNQNSTEILDALDFVDKDNDNEVSNQELVQGIIANYKDETSSFNPEIYNMILNLNSEKTNLETLLERINPDQDGEPSLTNQFDFIIDFKNGDLNYDENLIQAVIAAFPEARNILHTYELMETGNDGVNLRGYTTALMAINRGEATNPGTEIMAKFTEHVEHADIVNEAISTLDTINVDGVVSAAEFLNNFNQLFLRADMTVDMTKLNIFLGVSDIIYPDAAALNQFVQDVNTTIETPIDILSRWEVIDAFFNLNNHSITNPGTDIINVVLSRNPDKVPISNLVQNIDADHDGEISNLELTKNLLKFRRNEFTEDPALVQYILNKNSKFDEINSLISAFDRDGNGRVGDLELFAELFANRTGSYAGLSQAESSTIIAELKSTNQNSDRISSLVTNLDPDASGTVDYNELVAAYLSINAGTNSDFSDEFKNAIPGSSGNSLGIRALQADQLVDIVDSNNNGQISDIEIANLLIADKAVDTLASYDPALIEAIFNSNGNKTKIETIINQLDPNDDGVFDRAEVISAILDQRRDPTRFGSDYPLVQEILTAHNAEFAPIQSAIDVIDINGSGSISDQEAMNILVKQVTGNMAGLNTEIANAIINKNQNITDIREAFSNYGLNLNSTSLTEDLFTMWVEVQQGIRTVEYFDELVSALNLSSEFTRLTTQFSQIAGADNITSTSEYGQLIVDIITGEKSATEYQLLINILSRDPSLAAIKTIIDNFNLDGDNTLDDQNILEGILAIRRNGDLSIMNEPYIQTLLAMNSDSAAIIKLLELADPDQTGNLNLTRLVQIWLDTINEKSKSPPNLAYDFNNDGRVDNKDKDTVIKLHDYVNANMEFIVLH